MNTLLGGNIYAGLTGLEIEIDSVDLGDGVSLAKTFAHLMSPYIMAFAPALPGKPHPAPWKAALGGNSFDIPLQLLIPSTLRAESEERLEIANIIVFLIRLWINPATTIAVLSSHPFSELKDIPDRSAVIMPYQVERRYFPLGVQGFYASLENFMWVKSHWEATERLATNHPEFRLAMDAIQSAQFIPNSALALVALWGALEALFSPSTMELKFRVSALIASYTSKPGRERVSKYHEILKLYDRRSQAAHGLPKHDPKDVLKTFELLREVLVKMINEERVPKKDELEKLLLGDDASPLH